jgi:hypothetical protein
MYTPYSIDNEVINILETLLKQFKEERPENVWPDYPIIERADTFLEAERERHKEWKRRNRGQENYPLIYG